MRRPSNSCGRFRQHEQRIVGIPGNVELARREEATAIARRLRAVDRRQLGQRCQSSTKTPASRAALRPGDVAILFRALSDVQLYEEALREHGLEYYLVGGHAFYAQQEIFDVLNLLRAVASTADEVSLAGVLRSPFFALADETLFWLVERGGSLNAGLFAEQLPLELSGEEQAKVAAAASTIGRLRAIKDIVPDRDAAERSARPHRLRRRATRRVPGRTQARQPAEAHRARPHGRPRTATTSTISSRSSRSSSPNRRRSRSPPRSAESADVIRLMTIHRAKGLEFPFVVVPDLDRPPRLDGPDAALDDELGPLVRLPNDESREETTTGMTLFVARERAAELEERKRLLYVACTRAADYLVALQQPRCARQTEKRLDGADRRSLQFGDGPLPRRTTCRLRTAARPHAPPPATGQKTIGRSRGPDLVRMLEEAHALAADGAGIIPPHIGPIPVHRAARRQFSFSRLTGQLVRSADRAGATAGSPSSAARVPLLARPAVPLLPHPCSMPASSACSFTTCYPASITAARPSRPTSPVGANIWPHSMSFIKQTTRPRSPAQ